ncbi:SdpI family protein [Haloechinothrix sp. YIM 98757]|uniref:SdpI family protein n=1 Tax=Haloechinothrix aidingensis TaxID=2752311 RepID=A0A838AAM3_9PSEU|nr:SdpI family protein [Haloechinothrix aidingensis]MBA0126266.1 SdpI family protein [Haloechinothrix aidingensis]
MTTEQQTHKFSGLAWTGLILGIVGLVGSVIPILNNVTAVVAAVGFILGIIALFGTRKLLAGIGVALCVAAIAATVAAQQAFVDELEGPADVTETDENGNGSGDEESSSEVTTYEYRVTGEGEVSISYGTVSGDGSSTSSTDTTPPWSKTIEVTDEGIMFTPTLSVTSMSTDGQIACEIVRNGEVVTSQDASGDYASVHCSA